MGSEQPPTSTGHLLDHEKQSLAQLVQNREFRAALNKAQELIRSYPADPFLPMVCGSVFTLAGKPKEAAPFFQKAIKLDPSSVDGHYNLGITLKALGSLTAAHDSLGRALNLAPNHIPSLVQLGVVCHDQGHYSSAVERLQFAVALDANQAEAWHQLGRALHRLDKFQEADEAFRAAILGDPKHFQARSHYALLLRDMGNSSDSIEQARTSVDLSPKNAGLWNNLGSCHLSFKHFEDAIECFEKAIRLQPGFLDAINNLAKAHTDLGILWNASADHLSRGVDIYKQVLKRYPSARAWSQLAVALERYGEFDAALQAHNKAIELGPDNARLYSRRATFLLRYRHDALGLSDHEHRFDRVKVVRHPSPRWQGEPLVNKTIAVLPEQGLGDQLQFLRFLPLLKAKGCNIVLVANPKLASLFEASGLADQVVCMGEPLPPTDYNIPIMSIPHQLGVTLDCASGKRYLRADPQLTVFWAEKCKRYKGKLVGVHWQGNPEYGADFSRSFPLCSFAPMADLPSANLISIQKGELGTSQIPAFRHKHQLDEMDEIAGFATGFDDLAALMTVLDMVVTSDTSVAHLAGALGVETHLVLGLFPDWRWQGTGNTTHWYDSMTVWRQSRGESWTEVVERLATSKRDEQ